MTRTHTEHRRTRLNHRDREGIHAYPFSRKALGTYWLNVGTLRMRGSCEADLAGGPRGMSPHLPLGSRASLHPGYKTEERKNAVVYNVIACVDLAVPEEGGTEGGGKILGRGEKGGSFEVGGGGYVYGTWGGCLQHLVLR